MLVTSYGAIHYLENRVSWRGFGLIYRINHNCVDISIALHDLLLEPCNIFSGIEVWISLKLRVSVRLKGKRKKFSKT